VSRYGTVNGGFKKCLGTHLHCGFGTEQESGNLSNQASAGLVKTTVDPSPAAASTAPSKVGTVFLTENSPDVASDEGKLGIHV
jgi:hypothetical protein